MSETWCDMRFQCPKCGRFVPESAVGSEDFPDGSEYYGIRTESWTDCTACGHISGYGMVCVGAYPIDVSA